MDVSELIRDLPVTTSFSGNLSLNDIRIDSRKVTHGDLFVAREGETEDGHQYIDDAIDRGASAVLTRKSWHQSQDRPPSNGSIAHLLTEHPSQLVATLLTRFYESPSAELTLVGITGTNGKTTTTYLVKSILEASGASTGLIGTIERSFEGESESPGCTTPSIADTYRLLRNWVNRGADAAVMEVSSHGLDQGRVRGLNFDIGGFTNLTQDHLNYHGSMDNYFEAKKRLIEMADLGVVYNDGEWGGRLADLGHVVTVGEQAQYQVSDQRVDIDGIKCTVNTPDDGIVELSSPLTGLFNYKNISLASTICLQLGIKSDQVCKGIKQCERIPGRCDRLEGPPAIIVDYAHTHDAMENVVDSLRPVAEDRLICVFGAGGDRDPGKRPKMGRIAGEKTDYAVVTSDNPRTESPQAIIDDILEGMTEYNNYHVEQDRGQAIRDAVEYAGHDDLVLIVGKGHETEQVIGDRVIPFEDREVAREVLKTVG